MHITKTSRAGIMLTATAAILAISAPAFAQNTKPLLQYIPNGMGFVMGADIAASRGKTAFKEGVRFIKDQPQGRRIFRTFSKQTGLKLDKDIDQVVIAFDKFQQRRSPKKIAIIATGNFDQKDILNKIKSEDKKATIIKVGGKTFLKSPKGNALVGFLDKRTLYFAGGDKSVVKNAKKLIVGKGKNISSDKRVSGWLNNIDTNKNIWVVMDSSHVGGKVKTKIVFSEMDFSKGVHVRSQVAMARAADATNIATQVEERRTSLGLALAMFGARPLLTNLKFKNSGTNLDAQTSMTGAEVRTMFQLLREQAKQRRIAAKRAKEERKKALEAEKANKDAAKPPADAAQAPPPAK